MKVNEFVEYMKKNTNRATREDQVLSMAQKQLEAKPYLSIKAKRDLIDKIIDACLLYDDGVYKFDGIAKYVYFTMYTIEAYTSLELNEDIEDDFDLLSESKLLPIVISTIQNEYDDVNILLQMQCDSLLENNSVEAQMGKFCDRAMDLMDNLEVGIKGFVDQMPIENLDLTKIFNILNKFGVGQGG